MTMTNVNFAIEFYQFFGHCDLDCLNFLWYRKGLNSFKIKSFKFLKLPEHHQNYNPDMFLIKRVENLMFNQSGYSSWVRIVFN